jgi:alkylhydroperoxidase/carboxymuconolactone decarboxylase family protein YurZ
VTSIPNAELTDNVLFADVWERPGLSKLARDLLTIAALIALNRPEQLRAHLQRVALVDNVTARGTALSYLSMNGKGHTIWEVPGSRNARSNQAPWNIPSSDGRHLAINGFILSSNVWMVENF